MIKYLIGFLFCIISLPSLAHTVYCFPAFDPGTHNLSFAFTSTGKYSAGHGSFILEVEGKIYILPYNQCIIERD